MKQFIQGIDNDPHAWPTPARRSGGVLIEVVFDDLSDRYSIEMPDGGQRVTPVGIVRGVDPALSDERKDRLVGDVDIADAPGVVGRKVLVPKDLMRPMKKDEYEACGLDVPTDDNEWGDLAIIKHHRIIALMNDNPETKTLTVTKPGTDEKLKDVKTFPHEPDGARVFFEFDYDEDSMDEHETEGGIIVQEKNLASDNLMATVIAVGPDVEGTEVGDRIVVSRFSQRVELDGKPYYYVEDEAEILIHYVAMD